MREKSPYSYKSCKSLNKPTASPTYLDCVNFLIRNPAITPLLSVKETQHLDFIKDFCLDLEYEAHTLKQEEVSFQSSLDESRRSCLAIYGCKNRPDVFLATTVQTAKMEEIPSSLHLVNNDVFQNQECFLTAHPEQFFEAIKAFFRLQLFQGRQYLPHSVQLLDGQAEESPCVYFQLNWDQLQKGIHLVKMVLIILMQDSKAFLFQD